MWQADRTKPYRQAEKVLLRQVQEPLAFKAPVTRKLVEYENGGVSAMRERISRQPGNAETEKILQPSLCEQSEGEEGRGFKWECYMMWRLRAKL